MMMEKTRQIMKLSLQTPYFIPIDVARAITKVEWAEGMPPLPNIFPIVKCHLSLWTSHFTMIAKSRAKKGTAIVYSRRYVWKSLSIIRKNYWTAITRYSRLPDGAVIVAVSPVFFPISDRPRGDSLEILFSNIFASCAQTMRYVISDFSPTS